jgi:WD40 repeat protein
MIPYRTTLSFYFSSQPLFLDGDPQKKPNVRKCVELPFQQTKAELWDEVTDTLCNLDFIHAKACAKMTYDLVRDFNEVLDRIPDNAENIKQEKGRQARMEKYTCDLIACAKGEISIDKLEILESIKPWTQEQILAEVQRIKTKPTRADKLNDFINFLGVEADNLQNHAYRFSNLAFQQAWNHADSGSVSLAAEKKSEVFDCLICSKPSRPAWNPHPQILKFLNGSTNSIISLSINNNGKRAISISEDSKLILWDLDSGSIIESLKGFTNPVSITPDFKHLISFSEFELILTNLELRKEIKILKGHMDHVKSVCITPDGSRAISGDSNGMLILWDLVTGQVIKTFKKHLSSISTLCITADGKKAISGSDDHRLFLWDLESGKTIKTLKSSNSSNNSDRKPESINSHNQPSILWDLESGIIIENGESGKKKELTTKFITTTPDGKFAISITYTHKSEEFWYGIHNNNDTNQDNYLIIWNLESGQVISSYNNVRTKTRFEWNSSLMIQPINTVDISPDGKHIIFNYSDNELIHIDLLSGEFSKILKGHTAQIKTVCITPDGTRAISGDIDGKLILWDLVIGQAISSKNNHKSVVKNINITVDGKSAISGDSEGMLVFWDLESGERMDCFSGPEPVDNLSISWYGKYVLYSPFHYRARNPLFLWKPWSSKEDRKAKLDFLYLGTGKLDMRTIAVTPDGEHALSSCRDKTIILWDLSTGNEIKILKGHSIQINTFCLTLDGRNVVSGDQEGTLILWDLDSGQAINTLKGQEDWIQSVKITPDGKLAICSGVKSLILWNLKSKLFDKFLLETDKNIKNIKLTMDGKGIVIDYDDNTIDIWDLQLGTAIKTLDGHTKPIKAISVTMDGRRIITGSDDKTFIVWDLESGNQIAQSYMPFEVSSIASHPRGIAVGNKGGQVVFFHNNDNHLFPHIAIVNIVSFSDYKNKNSMDLFYFCPYCGQLSRPRNQIVECIKTIHKEGNIRLLDSPCIKLPKEAWEDPGLLGNCPKCGGELKFNPFIAGGDY